MEGVGKLWKSLSHSPRRTLLALSTFANFFCLGLAVSLFGPTLLDLGAHLGASVAQMGGMLTCRSVGYFIGSIVGGRIFDGLKRPCALVFVALVTVSFGIFLVPFCQNRVALGFVMAFQGFFMGFIDIGGNVLVLSLFGAEDVGPFMQALHCCFGLGAFAAPLVAKPFIGGGTEKIYAPNCETGESLTTTFGPTTSTISVTPSENVAWAFWIASLTFVPSCLVFLYLAITTPPGGEHQGRNEDSHSNAHRKSGTYRNLVLLLVAVFLGLYVGLEVSYGNYVSSYAIKYCPLRFSESDAALVTAVFWGLFTLGRFLAIFVSIFALPSTMAFADLAGCMVAVVVLFSFPSNANVLWVFSGIFGLFMASIFPSVMHMSEEFIDMNGSAASLTVIGAVFGEMSIPLTTANLFDSPVGPIGFMYMTLGASSLATLCFGAMYFYGTYFKPKQYQKVSGDDEESIELVEQRHPGGANPRSQSPDLFD